MIDTPKSVAESMRRMLEQRGMTRVSITTGPDELVQAATQDAPPVVQQAVRETCRLHQVGTKEIGDFPQNRDNLREDLPQVEYILEFQHCSIPLTDEILRFIKSQKPSGAETNHNNGMTFLNLFEGYIPDFWNRKTSETQAHRCRACQLPLDSLSGAHRSGLIYRHQACGDFPRREK